MQLQWEQRVSYHGQDTHIVDQNRDALLVSVLNITTLDSYTGTVQAA